MSFADHELLRADPARWIGVAADIARGHGFATGDLRPFATGSNLVAAIDRAHVLKIFPSMLHHQFVAERATLAVVADRLAVATPHVVAEGERDGWPYLVMTRLAGIPGEVAWPTLAEDQKVSVLGQIGELIAQVQALPPGPLLALEPRWHDLVPRQIAGCIAHHQELGLPARYLDGLAGYLADAVAIVPTDRPPVILTGEYIPENFLLREDPAGWRIAGLFDFGDVMTGWGEYDLLGPCTFMAAGVPARLRSLLAGYGRGDDALDPALARRLMTMFLLHRFSNLAAQVRIDGWQDRAQTLADLERLLWPVTAAR